MTHNSSSTSSTLALKVDTSLPGEPKDDERAPKGEASAGVGEAPDGTGSPELLHGEDLELPSGEGSF
jgi:hypothetical protein